MSINFSIKHELAGSSFGRTGIIATPHGDIHTPAFIPVGTKATVKTVLPEMLRELGAQAVLANAYHLYLQPGSEIVAEGGGLAQFMNWHGPTYTDSGGFQVLSLGAGLKKVLAMEVTEFQDTADNPAKNSLARIDDDGVTFRSHISGEKHRFTPEKSMRIQHNLGADIIFAFDELTTLTNTRSYQENSVERTRLWAQRCLQEHNHLLSERSGGPSLWGVVQGAQYEDLRKHAAQSLEKLSLQDQAAGGSGFEGYGIGGAIEKHRLGEIVGWVNSILPQDKPKHLLGISEPDDMFAAIEAGVDTFDCVMPSRVARSGAVYTFDGRVNLKNARFTRDFRPIEPELKNYSSDYTRAYIHHAIKGKETIFATLCTIHNLHFIVQLVDSIRQHIQYGTYWEYKEAFLSRYYASSGK